ncbi:MAG: nucleotidyltransferase domain-containing protein [Mediterranea sp.]|jgi:predicted nucleotidyltransferase|nr:nucleotidyltransferase domain-containing protein [Mediterranea sp.]
MRLRPTEIQIILQVAREIYGEGVRVYLFGSRTDDTKRGGDIDLLVRTTGEEKRGVLARIRMGARVKRHLGDQKIDIIGDDEESPVAHEALRTGILLQND